MAEKQLEVLANDTTCYSMPNEIPILEKDFGFEFHGPGFYLTEKSTYLVLVVPPLRKKPPVDGLWVASTMKWPMGSLIKVYIWDCPFQETIFAQIWSAPVRFDGRQKS